MFNPSKNAGLANIKTMPTIAVDLNGGHKAPDVSDVPEIKSISGDEAKRMLAVASWGPFAQIEIAIMKKISNSTNSMQCFQVPAIFQNKRLEKSDITKIIARIRITFKTAGMNFAIRYSDIHDAFILGPREYIGGGNKGPRKRRAALADVSS